MRYAFLALAAAAAVSGAAVASDYIVVKSDDPNIAVSSSIEAGARVPLARNATLTLMSAAGEVVTLTGSANGAVAPGGETSAADRSRFAALRAIVSRPPTRRAFGALRSGADCPEVSELTTIDAILMADEEECEAEAKEALDIFLAKAGSSDVAPAVVASEPPSEPVLQPVAAPALVAAPEPPATPEPVTPEPAAPELSAPEPTTTVETPASSVEPAPEAPALAEPAPAEDTTVETSGPPQSGFYILPSTPAEPVETPAPDADE